MKGERIGEFEELVLLTVYGLGAGAYGAAIQGKLERDVERPVSLGAVYAALARLEQKGYLTSWVGGATRQRGGRRKRYFVIADPGVAALNEMRRIRQKIWRALDERPAQGNVPQGKT